MFPSFEPRHAGTRSSPLAVPPPIATKKAQVARRQGGEADLGHLKTGAASCGRGQSEQACPNLSGNVIVTACENRSLNCIQPAIAWREALKNPGSRSIRTAAAVSRKVSTPNFLRVVGAQPPRVSFAADCFGLPRWAKPPENRCAAKRNLPSRPGAAPPRRRGKTWLKSARREAAVEGDRLNQGCRRIAAGSVVCGPLHHSIMAHSRVAGRSPSSRTTSTAVPIRRENVAKLADKPMADGCCAPRDNIIVGCGLVGPSGAGLGGGPVRPARARSSNQAMAKGKGGRHSKPKMRSPPGSVTIAPASWCLIRAACARRRAARSDATMKRGRPARWHSDDVVGGGQGFSPARRQHLVVSAEKRGRTTTGFIRKGEMRRRVGHAEVLRGSACYCRWRISTRQTAIGGNSQAGDRRLPAAAGTAVRPEDL